MREFFAISNFKSSFVKLYILHLVPLSALMLANFYYKDDTLRILTNRTWDGDGRFFASFLYNIINMFKDNLDIYPLSLFIGLVFCVLSGLILAFVINKEEILAKNKFSNWELVAVLPLCLQPMFLQNLSYRYEPVIMSFSLFCMVAIFLFKESRGWIFGLACFVFTLLSLATYQASHGIFFVLLLFFILKSFVLSVRQSEKFRERERELKVSLRFVVPSLVGTALAFVFYKIILSFSNLENYASGVSQFYAVNEMFDELIVGGRIAVYIEQVVDYLRPLPFFYLLFPVAFLFIWSFSGLKGKLFGALFLAVSLFGFVGFYLFLKTPFIVPRGFIGFGLVVALVCLHALANKKVALFLTKVNLALLTLSMFVFATTYANAYKAQYDWANYRAQIFAADVAKFIEPNSGESFRFGGSIGYAPLTAHFVMQYGSLAKKLAEVPKEPTRTWFYPFFVHKGFAIWSFFGSDNSCVGVTPEEAANSEVLVSSKFHKIHRVNRCFLVDFYPTVY